ncbi:hypothetical protein SLA2020_181220 [Shorea laevis]
MRGYDGDEYEDYGDYVMEGEELEVEDEEQGEEYEEEAEEEDRKPTEEEMEYLELRQRLKESIRQKRKRESGSLNAREKEKRPSYDTYGSFFGPSQPVIAQRVIQESKSLLENKQLVSKMLESKHSKKVNSASNGTGSKLGVTDRAPKISEVKRKVEKLKMARDYSFLSNDAELPVPTKDPPPRSFSVPNSEAQPAHLMLKSKQTLRNASTNFPGVREERKSVSLNGQGHTRAQSYKPIPAGKPNLTSIDSKKQLGINSGIGPGRPEGVKAFSLKSPSAAMNKKTPIPGVRNLPPNMQKAPSSKMHLSNSKQVVEQKRVMQEHSNGMLKRPVQPSMSKQPVPAASSMSKRPVPSSMSKRPEPSSMSMRPAPLSMSKLPPPSSLSKRPPPSSLSKQPVPSSISRSQIKKAPPKQVSSHGTAQFQQPKKKRLSEEDEALEEIRRMFNTQRYAGFDDDDSDMEANFDEIMKEERRSAKIGRMEDEEQERLIEEEERRERMRKLAKKRKLSH